MSKFTKEEQTEIVRWAMNLESVIANETTELGRLRTESFRSAPRAPKPLSGEAPTAPVREIASEKTRRKTRLQNQIAQKMDYTMEDFWKEDLAGEQTFFQRVFQNKPIQKGLIITIICALIGTILGFFPEGNPIRSLGYAIDSVSGLPLFAGIVFYFKKRAQFEKVKFERAEGDALEQLDAETAKKQKELDLQYEEKLKAYERDLANYDESKKAYKKSVENYEQVIVPQYEKEKAEWTAKQEVMINLIKNDLIANRANLKELYASTGLIAASLRTVNKLVWLYEDMSTSEHDIERATDMLLANMQLANSEEIKSEIANMNQNIVQGFNDVYYAIDSGFGELNGQIADSNAFLEEISANTKKTKRAIYADTIVGAVQRHNTNKTLKSTNPEFQALSKKFGR